MWVRRIGVELVTCALGLLTLSGCAERTERSETKIERVTLSSAPVVSGPFDVERYPQDWDERALGEFELGCGTTRCLAVHLASGAGSHLVATRISIAGQIVDAPRIVLGQNETVAGVVGCGDEFLVASTLSGGGIRYRRIRGSDGSILSDDPTPRLPAGPPVHMVSTGTTILILTSDAAGVLAQVFDRALEPVGEPVILPGFSPPAAGGVPGDGQYLVASYGEAARIDEATGASLDSPPVLFSRYNTGTGRRARGVYKDGVYQLAWAGGRGVYGARIEAATGTPLDPDDTFNEISGVKVLREVNANLTSEFDVDLISDNVVVTYGYTSRDLEALRVDVSTGLAMDATVADLGLLSPAIVSYPTFSVHGLGERAFLVNDATYLRTGTGYDDNRVVRFAEDRGIAKQSYPRYSPRLASNGSTYLAVFQRASTAHPSNPREIVGTRVDPATGAYLDDPPLMIGLGEDAAVASDGTDYLVLSLGFESGELRYHTRKVLADGTLLPDRSGRLEDSGSFLDVELTWNGTYYGAQFRSMAARFDADGEVVSPETGGYAPLLGSGFGDERAAVVADTTPAPDMRTFLFVGSGSSIVSDVTGVRVRSLTGSVLGSTTIAGGHWNPAAASDGTRALVVSQDRDTSEWWGRFVDFVTGLPIEGTAKLLPDLSDTSVGRVFFDGAAFGVTAMLEGPPRAVRLFRYTAELERVAGDPVDGTPLTHLDGNLHDHSAALAADGRGTFAYGAQDLDRLGLAVKLSFFNTDGSEPPEPPDAGAGGAGGAGSGTAGAGTGDAGEPGDDTGGAGDGHAGSNGSATGGTSTTGGTSSGGATSGGSANSSGGASTGGTQGVTGGADGAGGPGSDEGGRPGNPPGSAGENARPKGGGDDAGCGCRVGAPRRSTSPLLLLFALSLLALFRTAGRWTRRCTRGQADR